VTVRVASAFRADERTVPTGGMTAVRGYGTRLKVTEGGQETPRLRRSPIGPFGRSERRGWLVAVASALIFVAATCLAIPSGAAMAKRTPTDWVAHSAYGLQLSVPTTWAVAYFRNCPAGKVGTSLIATPAVLSYCQETSPDTNIVWMQPE
jgi:hypothetical protein